MNNNIQVLFVCTSYHSALHSEWEDRSMAHTIPRVGDSVNIFKYNRFDSQHQPTGETHPARAKVTNVEWFPDVKYTKTFTKFNARYDVVIDCELT